MRPDITNMTRRALLGRSMRALAAGLVAGQMPRIASAQSAPSGKTAVALAHGDSRSGNVIDALKRIEEEVRRGLVGKKRVLIKPNLVSITNQLAASHADCIAGVLEFLSPLVRKDQQLVVAESAASGPATEGFDNYGYPRLGKSHKVRFVDLDLEPTVVKYVVDEKYRPQPVRFAAPLLDPDTYIVSCAVMKTHDRAVATLSLKNLAVGALIKDTGYRWAPGSKGKNDKWLSHGGPANQGIHYNLFSLARVASPHLAVIDGFTGMEHNGPVQGTPVEHKVALASTDFLAADRVGVELMGFDFKKIGYLGFCARAGMGVTDMDAIEIRGPRVADHVRHYRPHDNIEQQYKWMVQG